MVSIFAAEKRDTKNKTKDYWPVVSELLISDFGSPTELWTRYGLLTIAGFLLYGISNDVAFLLWLAAYCIISYLNYQVLAQTRAPVGEIRFNIVFLFNALNSGAYLLLPMYLWQQDATGYQALALCALAGLAVFNLSRHHIRSRIAVWDVVLVETAIVFVGGSLMLTMDGIGQQAAVALGTLGIAVYYLLAQVYTISLHEDLQEARQDVLQTHKMQAVGQLTSGVAHDFNNLLTVIRGNIELAEISETEKERSQILDQARQAADRAASLTNQLLTFSRKARLDCRNVELKSFLGNIEPILSRLLPASLELKISHDPKASQVFCDPNQLENAIINLVINARDATRGSGQVDILITSEHHPSPFVIDGRTLTPGDYVAIEVKDNGPGISKKDLAQVVEPFFTTKAPGEGSGLGLSTVNGFTEQSGGAMKLASSREGTAVTLLLPAVSNGRT